LKVINVSKVALVVVLCAMLPRPQAQAQHNATLYFMRELPLANMLNPAFQPEAGSLYIGYPIVSSIYLDAGITASGASLNNLMGSQPNLRKIAENFSAYEGGNARLELSLFNLGILVRDMYFTFDVTTKAHTEVSVPGSLVKMAWYGNAPYLGRAVSLEGLGGQAAVYTEFAFGFSKEVLRDKITVGGKVKYLMGHMYAEGYMGPNSFVYTDPETWNITAGIAPEIYIAGLSSKVPRGVFGVGSLSFKSKGSAPFIAGNGGGVDLGFEIKGERFTASGSIINLGFISWKNTEYVEADKGYSIHTFTGVGIDSGNMVSQLRDSLYNATQLHGYTLTPLRRWTDPTMSFSGSYRLHRNFSAGMLVGMNISKYNNYPLLALALHTQELPINGAISYSYSNSHNLGLGVLFGRRETQLHLICDNVLAASYRTTRHVNLRMGLNLLLGAPKNTDPQKRTWQPLSPTKAEVREEKKAAKKRKVVNKTPINAGQQQSSPTAAPASKAPLNPVQQESSPKRSPQGTLSTPAGQEAPKSTVKNKKTLN